MVLTTNKIELELLAEYIEAGDTHNVVAILESTGNPSIFVNQAIDKDGNTPLHYATSIEMMECLMKFGADFKRVNKYGDNPFDSYARNLRFDLLDELLLRKYLPKYDTLIKSAYDKFPYGLGRKNITPRKLSSDLAVAQATSFRQCLWPILSSKIEFDMYSMGEGSKKYYLKLASLDSNDEVIKGIMKQCEMVGIKYTTRDIDGITIYHIDISTIPDKANLIEGVTAPLLNEFSLILDKEILRNSSLTSGEKKLEAKKLEEWGKAPRFSRQKYKLKPNMRAAESLRSLINVAYAKDETLLPELKILYHAILKGKLTSQGANKAVNEIVDFLGETPNNFRENILRDMDIDFAHKKTETVSERLPQAKGSARTRN